MALDGKVDLGGRGEQHVAEAFTLSGDSEGEGVSRTLSSRGQNKILYSAALL